MSWDGITNVSPERAWAAIINAHDPTNDALRVNLISGDTITLTGAVDTELPAIAALVDNTANPTTTSVGTFPHWFDGVTWDRALGNSIDGLLVNLGTNNDVTVTGSVTANAGTNLNTSALALESGGNLATAVTHLATIAGDTTDIETAVELIDDAIYTDDTDTHTTAVSKGMAIMAVALPTDSSVGSNEFGIVSMTQTRRLNVDATSNAANLATQATVASIDAATTVIAGMRKQEDAVSADLDFGIGVMAIRQDTPANTSGTDGDYEMLRMSAGRLWTSGVITGTVTVVHGITGVGHGVTTVTTAGTDVALAGSTACKRVTIQAQTDNTSIIAVGATGVDATVATGTGIVLYPGDSFELEIDNLADVFIDSLVNGEGVRYSYFT